MAVNDIRPEIKRRQSGNCRLGEERKLLNILINISVGLCACKIIFIVNEVELDSFIFQLQNPHILAPPCKIHVEMCHILHLVPPLLLNAQILGNHHANIEIFLVKILGQRSNYVCQTSGLNKGYCFGSNK